MGQLTRFPAGKYDDGVDVCSLIGRGLETIQAPRIQRNVPAERAAPRDIGGDRAWMAR
jgi:hypothetical protein